MSDNKSILRIDLGCGPNKREGFIGADSIAFPNVDIVTDLTETWPWSDESVDEAHASHFIEHLNALQRIHFVNELYRVLKKDAKATIIAPHWASCRAYGDPTHVFPPVCEFWFYYLQKTWRMQNAPHTDVQHMKGGFACDFESTWGYNMHPLLVPRNQEYQTYAVSWYKEAAQDIAATLTKK
jgi:hypothetical protein